MAAEDKDIKAKVIVQMAGSPKEHIEKTIRAYMDKLKTDYKKELNVLEENYSEAEKGDDGELYDVFCEMDILFHGLENLTFFCIDYMPASVEIISPDCLSLESSYFTDFINDLLSKLHRIDMALKNSNAKVINLKRNGLVLAKNLLLVILSKGPTGLSEISKVSGMPKDHVEKFLAELQKEGKIKKEKDLYLLS